MREPQPKAIVVLMMTAVLLAVSAGDARGPVRYTRHAPFDFGCVEQPPCPVQVQRARGGTLETTTVPEPAVVYGPPFVIPSGLTVGTTTGVFITTRSTRTLTASIYIRNLDGLSTRVTNLFGCIEVISQPSGIGYMAECAPISPGRARWASGSVRLPRGSYAIVADAYAWDDPVFGSVAHPITIRVETITYTFH